jgi:hypothetical protein
LQYLKFHFLETVYLSYILGKGIVLLQVNS